MVPGGPDPSLGFGVRQSLVKSGGGKFTPSVRTSRDKIGGESRRSQTQKGM